jgi:hypothetical protein
VELKKKVWKLCDTWQGAAPAFASLIEDQANGTTLIQEMQQQRVTPLSGRLWRFTLNADISSGTASAIRASNSAWSCHSKRWRS